MFQQITADVGRAAIRYSYLPYLWDKIRFIAHAAFIYMSVIGIHPIHGTLYFYPSKPLPFHLMWSVTRAARFKPARGVGKHTVLFQDTTTITDDLPAGHREWVNGRCLDISKQKVVHTFEKVFARQFFVDPESHQGPAVRKSNINAMHDGTIITCPAPRVEGYVYQRLVDNVVPGTDYIEDIRISIVGTEMPFVFLKRRPVEQRFWNTNSTVTVTNVESVLSDDERSKVLTFVRGIGLDFGEIDAARDRSTGELYIFDVNSTPFSPPRPLPFKKRLAIVRATAQAFTRQFIA